MRTKTVWLLAVLLLAVLCFAACDAGNTSSQTVCEKNGHTEVIDPAVAPTCTATGLTEGKHCSVCNEVLVKQTVVEATGHRYTATVIAPTETKSGYTTYTCTVCGDTYKDNYTQPTGSLGLSYTVNEDGKTCTVTGIGTCTDTEIIIPSINPEGYEVTSIGASAFKDCSSLWSITIPASVTSIGYYAFYGCSNLTSITIPASVTSIGEMAFSGCSGLEDITVSKENTVYHSAGNCLIETASKTLVAGCKTGVIPTDGSVTSIGDFAFYYCSSLTSITIPESVTGIGDFAFDHCRSLTSITIPASVTSIGQYTFYGCSSLASITIPDSVTSIGNYAFRGTAYYNNDENWNNSVLYIGKHLIGAKDSVSGAYQIVSGTLTIAGGAFEYCNCLTSITIPDSVTGIGTGAFYGCSYLTSITIPDSVMSIGSYAFGECSSLASVTFGENSQLTSIGNGAFEFCSSLTSIAIPARVTSIGVDAFSWCSSLTSITFGGTMAQWNSISKGSGWNYDTGAYKITCTDGVIGE